MKSLYLRLWLTVVAALLLFALASGWLVQRHLERERGRIDSAQAERLAAWGELIQRSLPGPQTDRAEQARALAEWSQRLRLPMALDDANGQRIGVAESFVRGEGLAGAAERRVLSIALEDGRTLSVMRPSLRRGSAAVGDDRPHGARHREGAVGGPQRGMLLLPPWLGGGPAGPMSGGVGLALLLAVLFVAVAAGAYPVVRGLTRRLEALGRGVEAFGQGALHRRVGVDGNDEVATLAVSFNRAAARIEALVRSHQSLLANASHELRSPLARLKMAVSMIDDATAEQRARLASEIHTNIAELDALVEEVLLASRLDAAPDIERRPVDLLALAIEEAARGGIDVTGEAVTVAGDERLLRRALRNLLENAHRYGGGAADVSLSRPTRDEVELRVCDRGPGVPQDQRDRIFEPFYRLPGHAEMSGGVGLGLSLVRQIAQSHGGHVRCEAREGGGSCFVLSLPAPSGAAAAGRSRERVAGSA